MRIRVSIAACCSALAAAHVWGSDADILRLQRERAQQQLELQLRMQQQQERALRAPSSTESAEVQHRQFEIDQQRRVQEFGREQSRAAAASAAAEQARSAARTPEAPPRAAGEGRINTDRSIAGGR